MDIGNCVAVGVDIQVPNDYQPLVASETDGVWGAASEVALPADADTAEQGVDLNADACTSPGNCVAVGSYENASGEALVLTETAGTWGPATGIAPPSAGTSAVLEGLACTSDGNCVAGGSYGTGTFASMPLLVSEVNGVWGAARTLTLPAGADGSTGQRAGIASIACPSAGHCIAVGGYTVGAPGFGAQVMVAQQSSGWTTLAVALPSGADSTNPNALLDSLACDATGECVAVGSYNGSYGGSGGEQGLIASGGTSGAWTSGQLTGLPDATNSARLGTVTCTSGGYCVAGGDLFDVGQPLVAVGTSTGGASSWTATEIANPSGQGNGEINQVACASTGDCEAIGSFAPGTSAPPAVLLASETGGVWSQASELTLPPGANTAGGQGLQDGGGLACAPSGDCIGAGDYEDASGNAQAWVASESGGAWGPASEVTVPPQTSSPSAPSTTTSASTTTTTTTTPAAMASNPTPAPPPAGVGASDLGSPTSGILDSGAPLTLSSAARSGTAVVSVPAGALPTGTVISLYPVLDGAPLAAAVPAGQSYVVSFALSWLAPAGTSPAATAPLTLTLTDPSITAGETIYDLASSGLVDVGFATENGVATITLTSDPLFVVASLTARRLSLKDHEGVTIIGYDARAKVGAKVTVTLVRSHRLLRQATVRVGSGDRFTWTTGSLSSGTYTVTFRIKEKVGKETTINVAVAPKQKQSR